MNELIPVLLNDLIKFLEEPVVGWVEKEIENYYDEKLLENATNLDALLMIWSYAHKIEDFAP